MRVAIQLLHENARLPVYASEQAAGADIFSCLEQELVLQPLARALVPTGLALELPEGYEAQVRPRSGLAFKHGIALVNAPGTIDADYRGELRILLINLGSEAVTIRHGDRIAQLVIAPVLQASFESVQSLSPTERASGGFGSTGR